MIFVFDVWHKGWGFGFTLTVWERFDDGYLEKLSFEWQVKLFGRTWGTGDE
ncbi:MAG: hypothetical protein NWE79_08075 [Candidatus Bathyarchaeota archaeon]|nr:hypothetical protein [Candidatus Bathyarchaeota archaeon]